MFYSRLPLLRVSMYLDITIGTAMTAAQRKSDFKITTHTPYLALTGELWDVYCEDLGDTWPHHKGTALY